LLLESIVCVFRRERVYSQLERELSALRARLFEEQQMIQQSFRRETVEQTTPRAADLEGGHGSDAEQNEDVFSLSDRSVLQDSFLDSGMSYG